MPISFSAAPRSAFTKGIAATFTVFGAPIAGGRSGAAIQGGLRPEGQQLLQPLLGLPGREKRNSRVGWTTSPCSLLTDELKLDDRTHVARTSAFYSVWPGHLHRPQLVRHATRVRLLPLSQLHEMDPAGSPPSPGSAERPGPGQHRSGPALRQWQRHSAAENVNGVEGKRRPATACKYIVEDRRSDPQALGHPLPVWTSADDQTSLTRRSVLFGNTRYYKRMDDLLGGDFWLDVDQFAQRLR